MLFGFTVSTLLCLGACEEKQQENTLTPAVDNTDSIIPTAAGSFLASKFGYDAKDMDSAVRFLDKTLEFDGKNKALLQQALLLAIIKGDSKGFVETAQELKANDDGTHLTDIILATAAFKEGDYRKAQKIFQDVPNTGVNELWFVLFNAWTEIGKGNPAKAFEAFETLAYTPEARPFSLLHQALIHDYLKTPDKARLAYREAADNMLSIPLRFALLYGNFLHQTNKTAERDALFTRFTEKNPDSSMAGQLFAALRQGKTQGMGLIVSPRAGLAQAFFDIASMLNVEHSRETSLLFTQLALYLYPEFDFARILLANILESKGLSTDAKQAYASLSPDSPLWRIGQLRYADLLIQEKQEAEAEKLLRALILDMPDKTDALIQLGDLLRGQKKFQESIEVYTQVIDTLNPPKPRHWAVFYARGVCFEQIKQWDKAEKDLLKAVELQPEEPFVLNYLGYSWVDRGINLEKALGLLRRAVALEPKDGYIIDSLGWAYFKMNNLKKAEKYLEKAIELAPSDPTINDHLGDLYLKLGRKREARYQWQRALTFEPEAELKEQLNRKLKKTEL